MTKLHHYTTDGIEVTYERERCIHAAECVLRLRTVFDTSERPWVKPENAGADEIAEVVEYCPTGSLHYTRTDGGLNEIPDDVNSVTVVANGPLYVRGEIEITAADGSVQVKDTRLALCRCGESKNKPYCDNSHKEMRFRDPGYAGKELAPQEITVTKGKLSILPNPNGSLKLSGPCEIRTGDGKIERIARVSLCRCGHSKTKPYCDATHKEIGFTTE